MTVSDTPPNPQGGLADRIGAWLAEWQSLINSGDIRTAEPLFSPDALGFGSLTSVMDGRDMLVREQWSRMWPTIKDFQFDRDTMRTYGWPNDSVVAVALTWKSLGRTGKAGWYARRGRATLILQQSNGGLVCVHSHFSMEPGVPPMAD